jgi:hypothetical protein
MQIEHEFCRMKDLKSFSLKNVFRARAHGSVWAKSSSGSSASSAEVPAKAKGAPSRNTHARAPGAVRSIGRASQTGIDSPSGPPLSGPKPRLLGQLQGVISSHRRAFRGVLAAQLRITNPQRDFRVMP